MATKKTTRAKCPVLQYVVARECRGCESFTVEAKSSRLGSVGHMYVGRKFESQPVLQRVNEIWVVPDLQRCGVGTRMYETAAREACRMRARLASDEIRSKAAHAFWLKQVRKGRAECARRAKQHGDLNRDGCAYYFITQCPVRSLSGAK